MEVALERTFGFDVTTFVRSPGEVRKAVKHDFLHIDETLVHTDSTLLRLWRLADACVSCGCYGLGAVGDLQFGEMLDT
jgi:hypothetical protein